MNQKEARKFLEAIARGWSIARAAKTAGVTLAAPYEFRRNNAAFAQQWRMAYEAGTDRMEDTAVDRAINGVQEGVWHKGQLVGFQVRYSDSLLQFLLKSRRPHKYAHYSLENGNEDQLPDIRGEDVAQLIEGKLASLASRQIAIESTDDNIEEFDS